MSLPRELALGSVLLTLGFVSCESKPAAPAPAADERTPPTPSDRANPETAPSPVPAASAEQYLVWQTPAASAPGAARGYETAWIQADGEQFQLLGRTSGAWMATRDRVYEWDDREQAIHPLSCAAMMDEGAAKPEERSDLVRRRVLLSSPDRSALAVVNAPPLAADAAYDDYEDSVELLGQAGKFLFVHQTTSTYACGAHGDVRDEMWIVSIDTGARIDPTALTDAAALHGAYLPAALEQFRGKDPEGDWSAIKGPEDFPLVAIYPRYDDGRLALDYRFAVDACYACSDGEWSSYSVSAVLPASSIPTRLTAVETLPAAVRAFTDREPHPGGPYRLGWSRVEAKAEAVLRGVFSAERGTD